MCFLFSSCEVFTDTCVDCASGVLQCDVCHFQDTMPDGSCSACELLVSFGVYDYENICTDACLVDCTDRFEDSCYLVLNNTEQHDNAVNRWKPKTNVIPGFSIHCQCFPAAVRNARTEEVTWGASTRRKRTPLFFPWFVVSVYWLFHGTTKVSSPWGAFLGLAWSGTENVWEDGSSWDYQNFGEGDSDTIVHLV